MAKQNTTKHTHRHHRMNDDNGFLHGLFSFSQITYLFDRQTIPPTPLFVNRQIIYEKLGAMTITERGR